MALQNVKLTIAYDGSSYHGWQKQRGCVTIESLITEAIERLTCCDDFKLIGSSRTDAGVSALGQVANLLIDTPIPAAKFAKALTQLLPKTIAVKESIEVDADFDAIKCAKSKLYRYSIYTGKVRPVLNIHSCWHRPGKLDITAMNDAASKLVGTKDFKSFATASDKRTSSLRTVFQCQVSGQDQWGYIDIEADGFLYNMARNIVGTLVEIGRGRWKPEAVDKILMAKSRCSAGPIAPANGLCLMWIKY
ncbi:MAG: tRNA pseudouridine(38-40) synthase TruA [Planctomycetota bacterium]